MSPLLALQCIAAALDKGMRLRTCTACQKECNAKIRDEVVAISDNVLISVHRNSRDGSRRKDSTSVEILQQLTIETKSGPVDLELYGVDVHIGTSTNHGHYIALLRSDGRWFKYDDSEVSVFDPARMGEYNETAYNLLYRRKCITPGPAFQDVAAALQRLLKGKRKRVARSKLETSGRKASVRLCALSENGARSSDSCVLLLCRRMAGRGSKAGATRSSPAATSPRAPRRSSPAATSPRAPR